MTQPPKLTGRPCRFWTLIILCFSAALSCSWRLHQAALAPRSGHAPVTNSMPNCQLAVTASDSAQHQAACSLLLTGNPALPPRPSLQPGESVVLYLGVGSTVVLTQGCCDGKGTFSASVMVDTSIPVEFRTSDRADRKGERLQRAWDGVRSWGRGGKLSRQPGACYLWGQVLFCEVWGLYSLQGPLCTYMCTYMCHS